MHGKWKHFKIDYNPSLLIKK
uniref:Uncharacterized protein n=1 Tax=Anguilla anguilla TaxID=7936 RepID=A0A0E9UUX3_ANGAN